MVKPIGDEIGFAAEISVEAMQRFLLDCMLRPWAAEEDRLEERFGHELSKDWRLRQLAK